MDIASMLAGIGAEGGMMGSTSGVVDEEEEGRGLLVACLREGPSLARLHRGGERREKREGKDSSRASRQRTRRERKPFGQSCSRPKRPGCTWGRPLFESDA